MYLNEERLLVNSRINFCVSFIITLVVISLILFQDNVADAQELNITTVAGNGEQGFSGDGGPATKAVLAFPMDVSVDSVGNIFFVDSFNERIRKVDVKTGNITTIVRSGNQIDSDHGLLTIGLFTTSSVSVDSSGNIFFPGTTSFIFEGFDIRESKIFKIDGKTGIITTVDINLSDDGDAGSTFLTFSPRDIFLDSSGNIFYVDRNRIFKVDGNTGAITTMAGNGKIGFSGDGRSATAASLNLDIISNICVDSSGNIFVADSNNNRIRKIDGRTGIINTVAGGGIIAGDAFNDGVVSDEEIGDGGPAIEAVLNFPEGVSVDDLGNIFIADTNNTRIRKVDGQTGIITTVVGAGEGFISDEICSAKKILFFPNGVSIDNAGSIYIVDTGGHRIRKAFLPKIDIYDPACSSEEVRSTDEKNCKGDNLVEKNGDVVINESKLEQIISADVRRKGIVADGVTKLLLRIKSDEPVTFSLPSGPDFGVLINLDGNIQGDTITVEPITVMDENYAFVNYCVPIDFPGGLNDVRQGVDVKIEASDSSGISSACLALYPPPVVLVHGVWSDGRAWEGLDDFLTNNGFLNIRIDYGTFASAGSFDPEVLDQYVVGTLITGTDKILEKFRNLGIAATQVDVIGHSMGGLVARSRVASPPNRPYKSIDNYNKGTFHKLITVGTPHLGSLLADFLIFRKCDTILTIGPITFPPTPPIIKITLEQFFEDKLGKPLGPGIFGMQTNSRAIENLGVTKIPAHAIVGIAPASSATENFLNFIMRKTEDTGARIDNVLGPNHDTIVPNASQRGNMRSSATSDSIGLGELVVHAPFPVKFAATISETESTIFWEEIQRLLLAKVNSDDFSDEIPPFKRRGTTILSFECEETTSGIISAAATSSGAATIKPDAGTIVTPEQTIDIEFTPPENVKVEGVLFILDDLIHLIEGEGPYSFSFDVPLDHIGRFEIQAYAFGEGNEDFSAFTHVNIEHDKEFASINAFLTNALLEKIGDQSQIIVEGHFEDGSTIDITSSNAGTTYSLKSGKSDVISISDEGVITVNDTASETILISNSGLSTELPINITIKDLTPDELPVLSGLGPTIFFQGNIVNVTLTGENFSPDMSIDVSGTEVTVSDINVVSDTLATAIFNINCTTSINLRTVSVTTDAGTSNTINIVTIEQPPFPLITQFSVDITTGQGPLTVNFTDESDASFTIIDSWLWDFGDGNTSNEQNSTHTYSTEGTFTVSLTVTSPCESDTWTEMELIKVTEDPPIIPVPTISAFSPTSISFSHDSGIQTVIITGTNFTGATDVRIGGVSARSFTVNSDSQITANVISGSSGNVSVVTPGGTATLPGFRFNFVTFEAKPVIDGDVDQDGKVTIEDVSLTFESLFDPTLLDPDQEDNADVDSDGEVTIGDVSCIFDSLFGAECGEDDLEQGN